MSSFGYSLVDSAVELAKIESLGAAKDFLQQQMNAYNFKLYEQVMCIGRFNRIIKESYYLVRNDK